MLCFNFFLMRKFKTDFVSEAKNSSMDCKKTYQELFYYLEDKENHPLNSEIKTHLQNCTACNEQANKLEKVLLKMDKMKIIENEDDFYEKILFRMNNTKKNQGKITLKFARIAAVAAIFIVTTSVGVMAGYISSNEILATENLKSKAAQSQDTELTAYTDNSFSLLEENYTNE